MGARVCGGPKWTVSPVYEGMLKEELDAAAARHPAVAYQPLLIDATYAGLIGGAADAPLVIPALNRDGDCLSDLVMPMFGSIAGAESVLLAFDAAYEPLVAMAEAPHGTAPGLAGRDVANPMAMLLSCAAVLHQGAQRGYDGTGDRSRAIYEAVMETTAAGIGTPDLGGHASSTQVTDDVVRRVAARLGPRVRSGALTDSRPPHRCRRPCKFRCTSKAQAWLLRAKSPSPSGLWPTARPFRPGRTVAYEHMFPRTAPKKAIPGLPSRDQLRSAMGLALAALTLADDAQPADWHLPAGYVSRAHAGPSRSRKSAPPAAAEPAHRQQTLPQADSHPHRRALAHRRARRRGGSAPAPAHPCLSPLHRPSGASVCRTPTR